ncbi:MAG: fatty acid desaturase [Myxococcaceae bacterium]|nr:fatty acid desaturase [Myxococcaceae bacterium]
MNARTITHEKINWPASLPFIAMHFTLLLPLVVGIEWHWVLLAVASYYVRMFGVTAGYHRYFSHRAFKTNRFFQFLLACLAQTSVQKGVLWWAAHHRHHHRESDQEGDIHSPIQSGFWWSHVGWILSKKYDATRYDSIRDFARYPELRFLNRFFVLPFLVMVAALWAWGGFVAVVWGAFIPTVFLWHGTFTINSLSHVFGSRRYLTTDLSRNNALLALITCGEGWHNNHHYHQNTANQGWFWWEVDLSYYALRVLAVFRVVKDLRLPDAATRDAHLKYTDAQKAALKSKRLVTKLTFASPVPVGLAGPAMVPATKQQ